MFAEPARLPLHPAAEQEQQFPLPRAPAGALQRRLPQTPRTLHLPRRSGIVDIIGRSITVSVVPLLSPFAACDAKNQFCFVTF